MVSDLDGRALKDYADVVSMRITKWVLPCATRLVFVPFTT